MKIKTQHINICHSAAKQWKNYNFKYVFGKISYINDLIFYFKKLGVKNNLNKK